MNSLRYIIWWPYMRACVYVCVKNVPINCTYLGRSIRALLSMQVQALIADWEGSQWLYSQNFQHFNEAMWNITQVSLSRCMWKTHACTHTSNSEYK